ncbi:MAG: GDSL-type esterase/lipase family protein [Oscillospiraceae bacterium]
MPIFIIMKYFIFGLILLISLTALAIGIAALVITLKGKNTTEIADCTRDYQVNPLKQMLKDCKTDEKGGIVFAGDSITELYNLKKWYPDYNVCNRGISGETTRNVLERFDSTILVMQPKLIVLLIGVNNLHYGLGVESAVNGVESIIINIREKLPSCKIILESTYPVNRNKTDKFSGYNGIATNAEIIAINYKLVELAEKFDLKYVDMACVLCDENGNFKKDLTVDGLHPDENGYEVITKKLKPIIDEMI